MKPEDKAPSTWLLRRGFRPLLPEHALAANLLSQAVDAHMAGEVEVAGRLIAAADLPVLKDFAISIMGRIDPVIHRQSTMPPSALMIPAAQQVPMPGLAHQMKVFARDGWHCRTCGVTVVSPKARQVLSRYYPQARWGKRNAQRHAGLFALMASLDHAMPRSRGGSNADDNLLTACWPCQFGRMEWTYEEVCFEDPRHTPAQLTAWDGLTRIHSARSSSPI